MDEVVLFFREIVEPTVAEFLAEPNAQRRGCLACLVLASLTEHYAHAIPGCDAGRLKQALRKECWAVGAVSDVANAVKHVARTQDGRWGYRDMSVQRMARVGVFRMGWPLGGEEVLVGPQADWRLTTLVTTAMSFWRRKIPIPDAVP